MAIGPLREVPPSAAMQGTLCSVAFDYAWLHTGSET